MGNSTNQRPIIHLSFDLEEFDTPSEYGATITEQEMFDISRQGTRNILDIVNKYNARSTFFTTVNFARSIPEELRAIVAHGHEPASHGMVHSGVTPPELLDSRLALEKMIKAPIHGFRAPRMGALSAENVRQAGYTYDSSLNPCFLPGRYNKFTAPRNIHREDRMLIVPASVSPVVRIPLFWLTFHNLNLSLFKALCRQTIRKDGHLVLYFHPWEFTDLTSPHLKMPFIIKNNCGEKMVKRLSQFIQEMSTEYNFAPIVENPKIAPYK